jgi:hypothetical protein
MFLSIRTLQFKLGLENVINTRLERIGAEKESITGHGIGTRPPVGILIFADDFDVGAHQHLESGAEAIPGVIVQC